MRHGRGDRIAWREHGPVEAGSPGEPVMMIMGLAASARMWYRLAPWISRRHRVILPDNRGTGSSPPARSRLTMASLADDALAALDEAEVDSAHVIGASMGGMIAQHIALDHRERVRSLVLACTTPGGRGGAPPWRMLAASALRPLVGSRRTFPVVVPLLYSDVTRDERPDRLREDLERRIADDTPARTVWAQMGGIAGHDTRGRLAELAGLPTLVLHGLDDALIPPDRGRDLAALIPGAQLTLLPSCGHILGTDAEEETATAMLAHLERSAAKAPARAEVTGS
jgi:pimeloyl-ACP methyl ester carboxylesterase